MILIPLLLTFLLGTQIVVTTHLRNVLRVSAQDQATQRGISGNFEYGDQFIHIESSGDGQNLDLLVTRGESDIPSLIPEIAFGGSHAITEGRRASLHGLAIVENQR